MFHVTTLISDTENVEKELIKNPPPSESEVGVARLLVKEKGEVVAELKSTNSSKEEVSASVVELNKAEDNLTRLEERFNLEPGQLQVETFACALSDVYTFGCTFRAEHSDTSRHLAEFWMVEPEIAFADLEDDIIVGRHM